ncbi:MAG TPA: hypothetical protein VK432_07340 [Stellaceae bacterium]|nr:hypothetical protein [Stellaceae bacterium]
MASFPDKAYPSAGGYIAGYREAMIRAWASVDLAAFDRAAAMIADINLHVAAENYGIVEDIHQSMMHAFAEYLRQSAMAPGTHVSQRF